MFGSVLSSWNWIDHWIVISGVLCAVATSLLGNFLVLRKMSLLGDAITHAVLPGIAVAFFVSESRSSTPMFVGAVIVGVLTALFTEWIRRFGKVDEGAAMGVVFTSLFALGLVLIVQAADHVDLDPSCVLYGAIEMTPLDRVGFAGFQVPRVAVTLSGVLLINLLFITLFYKELMLSSFDPALATTTGFHAWIMHYSLMTLVAMTAVASFESVGNILVVAMFVVPPAAASMLTDRLGRMIVLSAVLAASSAILGHMAAIVVPSWFGFRSTSTAGMMAVVAGLIFALAAMFGPRHGILVKLARQRILSLQILGEDILALLYRFTERNQEAAPSLMRLQELLLSGPTATRLMTWIYSRRGLVLHEGQAYRLTEAGSLYASRLVRTHRLWEQYLLDQAGVAAARIHDKAERFEHFTDADLRHRLDEEMESPKTDPHGRPIPSEAEDKT